MFKYSYRHKGGKRDRVPYIQKPWGATPLPSSENDRKNHNDVFIGEALCRKGAGRKDHSVKKASSKLKMLTSKKWNYPL